MSAEKPNYIDLKAPIMTIDCQQAFNRLDLREKLYAFHFSRASWEGSKICYFERSYESPALFYLFMKIFSVQTIEDVRAETLKSGLNEEEWKKLTAYIAGFLQNCGNYFSFGDNKFIPEISNEKFWAFVKSTEVYKLEPQKIEDLWKSVEKELYAHTKPFGQLGYKDDECLSSYYSSNITKADIDFIQKFLISIGSHSLNTRVIKLEDGSYQVLVCSYVSTGKVYEYEGKKINLIYGDFSSFMYKVIYHLKEAQKYAANDNQKKMIDEYIEHFRAGDVNRHKESQRVWIRDKGPIIETNIGFIEVYLDPAKVRGEFEGFVAVVDKEKSSKLGNLVATAEQSIANLPWGKDFEIDKFSKPDFTSLDVLTFACSGTPIGINLPNYDDITKTEGFKNVNLGNCYPKPKKDFIQYTREGDIDNIVKYNEEAVFVTVALHELLGHGTGKLFVKSKSGEFNFDKALKHPLTGGEITTWYEEGETWGSKFGKISSAYEECRADSVALYLSCFPEILSILLPGREQDFDDIVYTAWLNMASAGLKGLLFYSADTKQWGQAHIADRYAILQVLLEAGNDFVKIEEAEKDGKPYFYFTLDKSQIKTTGKKAIGDFLKKLQVYKSTGDNVEGTKFFERYLKVEEPFLKYRQIVLENRLPRRIELQDELRIVDDQTIEYVKFEETFEGLIRSKVEHHKDSFEDVYPIWKEYRDNFRLKN